MKTILNRVNTINGRTVKIDPTIMAWVRWRCCCPFSVLLFPCGFALLFFA